MAQAILKIVELTDEQFTAQTAARGGLRRADTSQQP
jgi:hypothetical protein